MNVKASRYMSLLLRHKPEDGNITLDAGGWALTARVIDALRKKGMSVSMVELREIVADNDKKRFELSPDGTKIRASQGHSIDVELGLTASLPPALLFHGTSTRFLTAIQRDGLLKMSRQHVHLSADVETAIKVGSRHGGSTVVLTVETEKAVAGGTLFYLSQNGVWLTDHVPVIYIKWNGLLYGDTETNSDSPLKILPGAKASGKDRRRFGR